MTHGHLEIPGVEDLAAAAGSELLPGAQRDAVADEAHRAVGERDVHPAGVIAPRRQMALIKRRPANAVAVPRIGRDCVRIKGGGQKAAVVLQPRVVERDGRAVADGWRGQVVRVRRRIRL